MASKIKVWKYGDKKAPPFPKDYDIVKRAVLQVTDIKDNHNKYYALELHQGKHKGKKTFRVFTHYGRTDDLDTNPDAGRKECRFFGDLADAEGCYKMIYAEKTSSRKGYQEVHLASSKIGSDKARGTSSDEMDAKTLAKLKNGKGTKAPAAKTSKLDPGVQELVKYIYSEATKALTSTVSAKITAQGIETPLGILTMGQIEKGEEILDEAYRLFKKKGASAKKQLTELSGEFYTAVPHRIGRSHKAVKIAVLDTMEEFREKQETLQLMKDMLSVNGEGGGVLYHAQVDEEYRALGCTIEHLPPKSDDHQEIKEHVEKSQVKTKNIKVKNVFLVRRPAEWSGFAKHINNQQLLFHGSGIHNWVGILSRGILLPKMVVRMGGGRTDEGWLGHGIYFGDAACTSAAYACPGKKGTCFLAVARVALGKVKDFYEITYGLAAPPKGYHSCHGVRADEEVSSDFYDDEYVIYTTEQHRMEYLVEFTQ
jgi:poly [ADP-ribose] polymerase